jgi:hypothetical protein
MADGFSARLNVRTVDGTVNTYPYQEKFANGSLTDNLDGTVSVVTPSTVTISSATIQVLISSFTTIFDATPVTGYTLLTVKAGAAQPQASSTVSIMQALDSNGTVAFKIRADRLVYATAFADMTEVVNFGSNGTRFGAAGSMFWANGVQYYTSAADTSISRSAASIVAIGNGTQGSTAGTIAVSTIAVTGITFATLGAAAANGTMVYCSDCTVTTAATCTANLLASCVCAGSGTGAIARRLNGTWLCGD